DMGQNYDVANAPARLSALIDQIFTDRPTASVIVGSLPLSLDSGINTLINSYNAAIPGIVSGKQSQGKAVSFVDVHAVVTTGDMYNSLHPNAAGYRKMAEAWYAGFRK